MNLGHLVVGFYFLSSGNLICQSMDILMYFRESLEFEITRAGCTFKIMKKVHGQVLKCLVLVHAGTELPFGQPALCQPSRTWVNSFLIHDGKEKRRRMGSAF